eukprot:scaffold91365_cov57-Phaeocystis_antarctica.AAC.1
MTFCDLCARPLWKQWRVPAKIRQRARCSAPARAHSIHAACVEAVARARCRQVEQPLGRVLGAHVAPVAHARRRRAAAPRAELRDRPRGDRLERRRRRVPSFVARADCPRQERLRRVSVWGLLVWGLLGWGLLVWVGSARLGFEPPCVHTKGVHVGEVEQRRGAQELAALPPLIRRHVRRGPTAR